MDEKNIGRNTDISKPTDTQLTEERKKWKDISAVMMLMVIDS